MDDTYRRLWILLRQRLTCQENGPGSEKYMAKANALHEALIWMAEMEAAEFLED